MHYIIGAIVVVVIFAGVIAATRDLARQEWNEQVKAENKKLEQLNTDVLNKKTKEGDLEALKAHKEAGKRWPGTD